MIRLKRTAGVTLIELMAAMFILLMCMTVIVPMIHTTGLVFNRGAADAQTKDLLAESALRIAPTLRNTLFVDTANSTAHTLVVVLPKVDPITKTYVSPVQNGDSISFYLSDTTGKPASQGTILWRSVNGVADKNWSLRSGKGRVDFSTNNLTFSFDNPVDPGIVTMTAYSTVWAGSKPKSGTVSTAILLRNHQFNGL